MGRPLELVLEELEGDILTPIAIYQRLPGKKKFLLESSLKHQASGRFSFIGANPVYELLSYGERTILRWASGREEVLMEKPLEVLKKLIPHEVFETKAPFPFIGGAVGFVSYDAIRQYENIGVMPKDELSFPDVHLMLFEEVVVFDHLQERVFLVGAPLELGTTLHELKQRLRRRKEEIYRPQDETVKPITISTYESTVTQEDFLEMVKRAKEYIAAGEIYQVVLSQRLKAKVDGDPFSFYRKLRVENPSPYMYYLDFAHYIMAGASPESLIKVTGKKVTTNPIAGTRPRGKTPEEDERLAAELLQDEKELAEHRMLVDLSRNDLGKVCEVGTVQVEKYMKIEKYRHVMHLVSEVSGLLKTSCSPLDALITCLPAGTVSGAPKIRAMEIINELEGLKRGPYSGAVGYFSLNGNLDFALTIRTMLIQEGTGYIQAGAGIVADSVPEKEYLETLHKLKAFLEEKR